MKQNCKLKLFLAVLMVASGMLQVQQTLAMSDKLIKQRIENKAADTFRLRGTEVNVAVEDSYVVLYGTVGLYIQKMLYEQIAWNTKGVVEVDNEIQVAPRSLQTDGAIERKIMELVNTYRRFQGVNIMVTVTEGAVDIRTTLDHPRDVLFLKRSVAEIDGVISIKIQARFIS